MYEVIKERPVPEQVEILTEKMVNVLSINSTAGETEIADKVHRILASFPYYKRHPELLWCQPLPDDPLGRKNVFAVIKGKPGAKKTVVLHCHTDTVGIEDFGENKHLATDPEKLRDYFAHWELDERVRQDARSGDWMFGRGALDMKSGVAVHLVNVLRLSEQAEKLDGNVVFMANPVEENEHTGVITAVSELARLREQNGWTYEVAINTDYTTEQYPGDDTRYIYTGTVGKLLPCFYVHGRTTHVGNTLLAVDPTLIASEINRRLNNRMELAEDIAGDVSLPPSCLKQTDLKDFYNVQIPIASFMYFNYFVYEKTPADVLNTLKRVAEEACFDVEQDLEKQYKHFCARHNMPHLSPSYRVNVLTFEELVDKVKALGIDVDAVVRDVVADNRGMELRELSLKIVQKVFGKDEAHDPTVVIFFAPPYCPHNYVKGETERDKELLAILQHQLEKTSELTGETFELKRFFPFLSDSSYLSLHAADGEIARLTDNFPGWGHAYHVPIQQIRKLNIPAINMGVYGMDGHQMTERVYKPYSFRVLPDLIYNTVRHILCRGTKGVGCEQVQVSELETNVER